MRVAMIIGKAQGDVVIPRLKMAKDNLNIDCYDSIVEFLNKSTQRGIIYDRIVTLCAKLTSQAVKDLYKYWSDTDKETGIVLLGKKGQDEEKAKAFLNIFTTPVAAVMMLQSTTVQLLAESVLLNPSELNKRYGVKDVLAVEFEDEEPVEEPQKPAKQQKPQQPKQEQAKPQQKEQPQNKKQKKGLFGGLFGGKNKQQQVQQEQVQQEEYAEEQSYDEPVQEDVQEPENQWVGKQEPEEDNSYKVKKSTVKNGVKPVQQKHQEPEQDFTDDDFGFMTSDDVPAPDANSYNESYNDDSNDVERKPSAVTDTYEESFENVETVQSDFTDDWEDSTTDDDFGDNTYQEPEPEPQQRPVQRTREQRVPQRQADVVEDEDWGTSEGFDSSFNDSSDQHQSYNADTVDDEDFGDSGFVYKPENIPAKYKRDVAHTVDDDDTQGLSVASAEEEYRQRNQSVRVVTRTVVKETGGGGTGSLKGVLSGRIKKTIIVTGDRATGITTTAFSLATYLSKYVDVLYFDCDIDNHGILSYIDYTTFQSYEESQINGVQMCKSSKAFDRCIVPWQDNLTLLTSDYSCDATTEDLQTAGEVVAERATDFGVVVVDCPIDKLTYIRDLAITANAVFCVEGSKRGFMNLLCSAEKSDLPIRFKRSLVSKGTMFVTKSSEKTDLKKLLKHITSFYEPGDVDWLSMRPIKFGGKYSDKIVNMIVEG